MTQGSVVQAALTVAGLRSEKVEQAIVEVKQELGAGTVCQISQLLFPRGVACAGTQTSLELLATKVKERGALQAKLLTTSGAFHTPLMESAKTPLEAALTEALPRMKPPKCNMYMNYT